MLLKTFRMGNLEATSGLEVFRTDRWTCARPVELAAAAFFMAFLAFNTSKSKGEGVH
jgi:hypothetical protein